MSTVYHDIAAEYVAAGISVIPIGLDGTKRPLFNRLPNVSQILSDDAVPESEKQKLANAKQWMRKWTPYQYRLPTPMELLRWFRSPAGIGIITGVVSGGLEVIDFDTDAENIFPAWRAMLSPEVRDKLCVCETGGGGYHVLSRSSEVCGNVKLAMTADGKETLIETRGEHGYIVGVGSPLSVHMSGEPYVQTHGAPLPELPVMTLDERKQIFVAAASFDRRSNVMEERVKERVRQLSPPPADIDASTPWGDFDARARWADVLEPGGWASTDGIHWTRPGKTSGSSAKVVIAKNGCEVLTVFSGNAGPLANTTGSSRTWGKFGAFAALNHGGDRREAARAARRAGYGQSNSKRWSA